MKKINDKENSNNLDDQSSSESFLKRWSVNKSKSKDTDVLKQVSDLESSEALNNEIAAEEKQIKVIRAIDKLDKPGFGLKGVEDLLKKERKDQSGAPL